MEINRESINVGQERALLVHVALPQASLSPGDSLDELASLAATAGAVVIDRVIQSRTRPHPGSYIGRGKVEQVAHYVEEFDIDVVIFDNDLSPAQIRELEKDIDCKIIDRSELILDIFASRARTHQARLQVDLAQLQYTYPRLTRMWSHLDTVTGAAGGGAIGAVGGIGTRGTGEKQLEIDRRIVQRRLSQLKGQIEQIDKRRLRQVRSRRDVFTISLVGYTKRRQEHALNTLTDAEVLAEDKLFATLDTKTVRWQVSREHLALLSDHGRFRARPAPPPRGQFPRDTGRSRQCRPPHPRRRRVPRPHRRPDRHRSTRSSKSWAASRRTTLLLLNKADVPAARTAADTYRTLHPESLVVSAKTGQGLDALRSAVLARITASVLTLEVACPAANGKVGSYLHDHGTVIDETYDDSSVTYHVRLGRNQLPALNRLTPLEIRESK